jgi:TPP-dependent pyruvate/acetoin dehydrogenase alpha subunit
MTTTALDRQTSLSIFERMLMMRHFEEAVIALYKQGRSSAIIISISPGSDRRRRPGSAG